MMVSALRQHTGGIAKLRTGVQACALVITAALSNVTMPAHAQPRAPVPNTAPASAPTMSKGEAKALRDFRLLDANGDGHLSRGEVKFFPPLAAAFSRADADGDGLVSQGEVRAFSAQYRAERARQKAAREARKAAPAVPR